MEFSSSITLNSHLSCRNLLESVGGDVSEAVKRLLLPKSISTSEIGIAKQNYATLLFYLIDSNDDRALADKFDTFYNLGQDTICGYVFKEGELVYHCVDCAVDNTCVFCQKCFNSSDHKGHQVKYQRSGGGGVCDCGDEEAWDPKGFCKQHSHNTSNTNERGIKGVTVAQDPLEGIPDNVVQALEIFFPAVLNEIISIADLHYLSFVQPAMGRYMAFVLCLVFSFYFLILIFLKFLFNV